MSATGDGQAEQLAQAIAAIEAQRADLGDVVADAALASMRRQLAELEGQHDLPQQQRKLATLLYTDVVGSTQLGHHLEPDEVLEIMDAALKRLAEPVENHGGHVARFQGDGFKAVFGVPVARENDPEQAVRAGLGILQVAQEIARDWEERQNLPGFQVRVGVNTGLVAAGGETEAADTIMGRAVNLAARLESAAPPGGLLISHHTYRHVRGVFTVEPCEPVQAKGFDEPVAVYLVKRAKPRAFRVLTRGVEGVETRMVGRETELKTLQDALLTAIEEGEGQVVTIVGEAGVGKSRLVSEFQNWIELLPERIELFLGQARQETQHLPYALLRDLFAFRFQIQDSDPVDVVRDKFEEGMAGAYPGQTQSFQASLPRQLGERFSSQQSTGEHSSDIEAKAHFLGQLLGFDFSHSPHLRGFLQDPQALRNRGLLSLGDYFTALCRRGPVAVLLEDVHWADDSSLDAIRQLGKKTPHLRLLILCLTRQRLYDRRPFWGEGEAYHRKLELQPLSKRESRQLVAEILKYVDHVPQALRELVVSGAEGNPFYTEEMIKMLIEQGVIVTSDIDPQGKERWRVVGERLAQVELPSTLAGVLQARLDSLPAEERVTLQQASVVGRTFWDQLVEHLSIQEAGIQNGKALAETLDALRAREMVFHREESTISGSLEYTFKHDLLREVTYETVLVRVRRRYHGLVADWLVANSGERVGEHLGLIGGHLEQAGRNEQAIEIFLQAGEHALSTYANPEAEGYYHRGLQLGSEGQVKAQLLFGLGRALSRQGHYEEAVKFWKEGIAIYQSLGDREGMIRLYTMAIRWSVFSHPKEAMDLLLEGLAFIEGLEEGPTLARFLSQAGRVYLFNGFAEEANQYCRRGLEMGERLGDVEVQADTLATMGILPGLPHEQLKTLQRAVELAETHHLLYMLGRSTNNLSVSFVLLFGNIREALRYIHRTLEIARLRGDHEGELRALSNAVSYFLLLGELDQARELSKQISARLEMLPEMKGVRVHMVNMRAVYLRQTGDWGLALETARQALEKSHQLGLLETWYDCVTGSLVPTLLDLDRFLQKPDWSVAEEALREALELIKKGGGFFSWHGSAHGLMSVISSRQGRLELAAGWLQQGVQVSGDSPPYFERKDLLQAEVELAVARNDWTQALDGYEAFVKLVDGAGQRWEVARAYLGWADACVARGEAGDRDQAEQRYRRSLAMFTEMGADGYEQVVKARLQALEAVMDGNGKQIRDRDG